MPIGAARAGFRKDRKPADSLGIADESWGWPVNQAPRNLSPLKPVDLAAEADFALGGLLVAPSVREVRTVDRRETVEPRVMQVLVALAREKGTVVSRDQLIERCWGGRLVGDDAINSCVAKVRALAALAADPAFDIETIPRVGYRMHGRDMGHLSDIASDGGAAEVAAKTPPWRTLALIAAMVAVVGVTVAVVLMFTERPREWVVAESHLPFIATPLVERRPAFSPDGTIIAYSAGTDLASRKIYLRLRSGGDPIRLTNDSFGAFAPAWSPDAGTIAYIGMEPGKPCRIMLIAVPAGPSRQIGHCQTSDFSALAWDHGGHALFFSDSAVTDQPQRIFRLDLASGKTTEMVRPVVTAADDHDFSISPDGRTMLVVRSFSGAISQIVLHTLPDGPERVLLQSDDDDVSAAWSSDAGTVFVASTTQGDSSLWAYPVSGASPWRITTSPVVIEALASGPDGLLAMGLESSESELAISPGSADHPPETLDNSGLDVRSMDYTSDGTLAVLAKQSGGAGIWLAEPGKPLHQLLRLPICGCGLRWSPDGSRFAYFETANGGSRIPVLSRGGAPVAQIVSTQDIGSVDWSADGKSLLTTRQDARGWRLWRTDLAQPDRSIPVSPYGWKFVRVLGNMMFGVKSGSAGVWRIDGKLRRLTDWPSQTQSWTWTIAGDRIVYPDYSDPAHPRFMAMPVTGGKAIPLGYATGMVNGSTIAVDPNSGRVVYLHRTREDSDIGWMRLARQ
jgi:Tol biopolymer transport system component/DNA-binding winged helix-turn-helix (wHTH) protein